jgi:hypothetical protein
MPIPMTAKRSDGSRRAIATWALAVAQLVSWGSIYYAFSLFVVPMERYKIWNAVIATVQNATSETK